MKKHKLLQKGIFILLMAVIFSGCSDSGTSTDSAASQSENSEEGTEAILQALSVSTSDMFTDRDYEIGYDESTSIRITLSDGASSASSSSVQIEDDVITITDTGTYILSGSLTNGMIIIDADDTDKIQLVLDNVELTSASSAAIYILNADKVFVTLAKDSQNTLINGGTFINIDDNNIDAVIFSKEDLTLNGEGSLEIISPAGHGIVSKDDLAITSGTYKITAGSHGLSGKDSVRIANGTFDITCGKDGIHAENDEDDTLGFLYICGGIFLISADDDGLHANTNLVITDGTIDIAKSYEGIEGLTIDITGGQITIVSEDDGLNAAGGNDQSGSFAPNAVDSDAYINIAGGTIYVNASGDGLDSNGTLYISGGEVYVAGPTNGADGALDYESDAVISGGIVVALGSSQMAMNFGTNSTQGVILVTSGSQEAGSTIELIGSDNEIILSYITDKSYNSVLISCPEITTGATYTLTAGTYSTEITMDSIIYGNSMDRFGPGGNMPDKGSFDFDGEMPDKGSFDFDGEMPDKGNFDFDGEMPGKGNRPSNEETFGTEL